MNLSPVTLFCVDSIQWSVTLPYKVLNYFSCNFFLIRLLNFTNKQNTDPATWPHMLDAFSTFYPEVPGDHVDQTKLAFPVTMFRLICKSRGVFLLGQTVRYPPTEIWQSSSIFTFVSEDPGTWRKVGSCTKSRRKSVAAITCKRQIRLSFWCDTQTQTISLVLLATLVLWFFLLFSRLGFFLLVKYFKTSDLSIWCSDLLFFTDLDHSNTVTSSTIFCEKFKVPEIF